MANSRNKNKVANAEFYEAKSRLGLSAMGDPGDEKLSINDTYLVSLARKIDNRLKRNQDIKRSLIKVRNGARKLKSGARRAKHMILKSRAKPAVSSSEDVDIKAIIPTIKLKAYKKPTLSIIIPAFNKVGYTVQCLASITRTLYPNSTISFEVILVDNGSSDETHLLKDIDNLVFVQNKENLGFVGGCNSGIDRAKGDYVIFLNNDAEITPGWLEQLHETIINDPSIGIVGSKIIYPNGILQEAGGIIFKNADGLNYGKFDQSDAYQYNYVRDVDYCSGASIIISRSLLKKFGGFDKLYQPAYYEDTDLSFKTRAEGLRVVYQPLSVIYHIEGGTAGTSTSTGFKKFQEINKGKFLNRWGKILASDHVNADEYYEGRDRSGNKLALIIEESVPTPDKDSGSVRMVAMIKSLQSLGYKVTFWPNDLKPKQPYTTNLQQMGVEVVYGGVDFMQFSKHFGHTYDVVIMSRPEICARYLNTCRSLYPNAKLVYDTVDLHYLRLSRQAEVEVTNAEQLLEQSKWYEKLEKGLMERVDATIVVSQTEIDVLKREGITAPLFVVSNIHRINKDAYKIGFAKRKDIVFVGNYAHLPNRDAVRWFKKEILPLVTRQDVTIKTHIVGANMPEDLATAMKAKNVIVHGFISDPNLYALLEKSRIFIAPLRYGAGVKGKVGQAIEYAVPTVSTTIAAEGMFITNGINGLVADNAQDFADAIMKLHKDAAVWKKIQTNARGIIEEHFSIEEATKQLGLLLK